jgi:hypothetical protein
MRNAIIAAIVAALVSSAVTFAAARNPPVRRWC